MTAFMAPTLDKLYLEWSQLTACQTNRELELKQELRDAKDQARRRLDTLEKVVAMLKAREIHEGDQILEIIGVVGESHTFRAKPTEWAEIRRLFGDDGTAVADRGGNGFQVSRYAMGKLREVIEEFS